MPRGIKRGDVLKNRYEILEEIGHGGMSRVYLASDRDVHNKQLAVKEVSRHAKDPAGRPIEQSLAQESKIMSKLSHPTIVDIVDTLVQDDFIYIVMDHVPGESLDKVVRREGPQSEEDVQQWMLEICDVLGYLHRQNPAIIYRDMKPNNIMLHPDGYVKLIDFGVVREYKDEADVRQDTIAFGTQGYAPPEQYGQSQTSPCSDIYAVGATMWHLLAGEAPSMEFPLRDVREVNPRVSQGFATIIKKCTALDPSERYQSCEELAANLEIYEKLNEDYINTEKRKVRTFAITGALAVILLAGGFGMLGARNAVVMQKYETHIALGDEMLQTRPDDAKAEYLEAIAERPDGIDAYEKLIAYYKLDNEFNLDEKSEFDNVYQQNYDVLQGNSRFAELSYEIGRLYWTYYTYGQTSGSNDRDENRANRIKASAEYFKNAISNPNFENFARADMYNGIAQFTTSITQKQREGDDDKETYGNYWTQLQELADRIPSEESDMVKLDSCALVLNAIETYLDKFYTVANVPQNEVEAMVKTVQQALGTEIRSNDEFESQRRELLNRLNNEVKRKITTVYSNASVGR